MDVIAKLKQNGGPLAMEAAATIERLNVELAQRSRASHNHEFAEIAELHATLPESMSLLPFAASAEALRKHALIATGYCDVSSVDAGSKAAAERVAAWMHYQSTRSVDGKEPGYCVTKTEGPVVLCYTPHSQRMSAMGKRRFEESKAAVLDWIKKEMEIGR